MKYLQLFLILALLGLTLSSKQLFDFLGQEDGDKIKKKSVEKPKVKSSLFEDTPGDLPKHSYETNPDIAFSQITEKVISHEGSEVNNAKIKSIQDKIKSLIEMNKELKEELHKSRKNAAKGDVLSFIQKHDSNVANVKRSVEITRQSLTSTITKEKQNLQIFYKSTSKDFTLYQTKYKDLKKQISQIKNDEIQKLQKLQMQFSTRSLKVNKLISVDGVSFINKVRSEAMQIGENLLLNKSRLQFGNENTTLHLNNLSVSVKDLFQASGYLNKIKDICGNSMENCSGISSNYLKTSESNGKSILSQLKDLKYHTNKILGHSKHK